VIPVLSKINQKLIAFIEIILKSILEIISKKQKFFANKMTQKITNQMKMIQKKQKK